MRALINSSTWVVNSRLRDIGLSRDIGLCIAGIALHNAALLTLY